VATLFIEDIIGKLKRGELRIPAFQRGFVWSPDDVAFLMDSIYKGYPFGSVLLWRTKYQLTQERNLGPFQVPEPTADYPIDYVLDGQQRLTSILGVFATDLPKTEDIEWNSVAYRAATKDFDAALAGRVDDLQKRFQQAQFPLSMVETEEKQRIAIVFERINRKGVPLDTFQLLTAWTWSEDFELKQQFEELAGELEPFGFNGVGEDTDLLLRCTAAVLSGKESAESLLTVGGAEVRHALPRIKKGIHSAIDFLQLNLEIQKLDNLPYSTSLIPLVAFFEGEESAQPSLTHEQVQVLKQWFWRTAFSRRYSSGTKRNLEADIREAKKLKGGASTLGSFDVNLSPSMFTERKFISGTVDTKTFILMLAAQKPKSIVNGGDISIGEVLAAGNKSEFHHLFPQAHLRANKVTAGRINSLANFCILSAADNKKLGGKKPSEYRPKLAKNVDLLLPSNLIPPSLFADDYQPFLSERGKLLTHAAYELMGRKTPSVPA
jgi:hypothetical protein